MNDYETQCAQGDQLDVDAAAAAATVDDDVSDDLNIDLYDSSCMNDNYHCKVSTLCMVIV